MFGQLFSEHNLNVIMVPHRPEEYEFVACMYNANWSCSQLGSCLFGSYAYLYLHSPTLRWVKFRSLTLPRGHFFFLEANNGVSSDSYTDVLVSSQIIST
jgi:hypothetical protein